MKIKSKAKICRRLGTVLFLKHRKHFIRRPYPPGPRGKRRGIPKMSEYKRELIEKQKLRFTYGLSERQLKNYFKKVLQKKTGIENKAEELLKLLEKRLDNVIYRAGLATTRAQARQMVSHKFFLVNNKSINVPSYQVKKGDIITIKESKKNKKVFQEILPQLKNINPPRWLKLNKEEAKIEIVGEPSLEETPPPAEISAVFEFYSR
jgi:small subunit ribosomal protein S4